MKSVLLAGKINLLIRLCLLFTRYLQRNFISVEEQKFNVQKVNPELYGNTVDKLFEDKALSLFSSGINIYRVHILNTKITA